MIGTVTFFSQEIERNVFFSTAERDDAGKRPPSKGKGPAVIISNLFYKATVWGDAVRTTE